MRKGRRFAVLERDRYTCRYCGRSAPDVVLHVDHVFPKSEGGSDRMDNLVTACRSCNLGKSARIIDADPPLLPGEPPPPPCGPWTCEICGNPIDDDAPGGLEITYLATTGYPREPEGTAFRFFHIYCDPDPETEGYWIGHHRARTADEWDGWARHLMDKRWMEGRVGDFLALWGEARVQEWKRGKELLWRTL